MQSLGGHGKVLERKAESLAFDRGLLEAVNVAVVHQYEEQYTVVPNEEIRAFSCLGSASENATFFAVAKADGRGWLLGLRND